MRRTISIISLLLTFLAAALIAQPSYYSPNANAAPQAPGANSQMRQGDALEHPLAAPLPRDHPNAQLAQELADLPPVPIPSSKPRVEPKGRKSATREIAFDLRTRSVYEIPKFISPLPSEEQGSDGEFMPGYPGPDTQADSKEQTKQPQIVIGADNRVRINDTTIYPWRAVCKVIVTFPSGNSYVGSRTLIGAKYVLTAGHVVNLEDEGGWASSVRVIPGLDGTYQPYGDAWGIRLRSYTGWTEDGSSNHDFALITLDRNIGNSTGYLGYMATDAPCCFSIDPILTWTGHISGYPADKEGGLGQYYHSKQLGSASLYLLYYSIDTSGGQSGSGVFKVSGAERKVFGIHTAWLNDWPYGNINQGTRINTQKYNSLKSWIASGL
jgi:V8-like Glu-specific endopeptidase